MTKVKFWHKEGKGPHPGQEGVAFVFANGVTLSIISNQGDLCTPGKNLELHAWGPNKERVNLKGRDDLVGWVRPDDLPGFIQRCKRWRPKEVPNGG